MAMLLERQTSGTEFLLKELQNPFNASVATTSLWFGIGSSLVIFAVLSLFFIILRPRNTLVYAPKIKYADEKHAPPAIGRGLFAWWSPVMATSETTVVEKVGLDAAVFLRFTRMCRNIFLVLTVIGCGILIPTHIFSSDTASTADLSGSTKALIQLTPQFVRGTPMWSHVAVSWLFDLTVLYYIWRNYQIILQMKRTYFQSSEYQESLHARSIWLIDIPAAERSEEGILRLADSVDQTASVPHAAIARNVKNLPDLIEQHGSAVRSLESVLAKYLKNPDQLPLRRPTMTPLKNDHRADRKTKVDAIDYLSRRIDELEIEIKDARETLDQRNPMSYGFATYSRIVDAHAVAHSARNKHPKGTTIRLAPKSNDLIWKNLALKKSSRTIKRVRNNIWIGLLTLIWIVPNALIAIFLVQLSNLAAVWPAFRQSFETNPNTWAAVQAIAAPGILSSIYILLPIFFRRLQIRAGDMTKTSRERHVTHKLYSFFIFNNLLVFSCFAAFFSFVSTVISFRNKYPNLSAWDAIAAGNLPNQIMVTLCLISPFWVNWLLQRNLGSAIDIGQLWTLAWVGFARTFMSPTPRQYIEWTAPPPFDYASYYNYYLFYATVAFCYTTLQPLVLPVTLLFFTVDVWLKKYLLLYVFITKTESGGQFWNLLVNRLLFALILANGIAALVVIAAMGSWVMIGCMAPLPLLILGFKYYCTQTFEVQCKYYSKAFLDESSVPQDDKHRRREGLAVKFGHPALHKPLITPMVHAKAQHALASIYHGRLDAESGTAAPPGIALDAMSTVEPGKYAHKPGTGLLGGNFEVIQESEMDFAYFKNRADFRDEHGGDGELYGRPHDLISERSHTPASFATNHGGRRESPSPGPMHRRPLPQGLQGPRFPPNRAMTGHMYSLSNDSDRRLLSDAQDIGEGHVDSDDDGAGHEQYGLDRWRPAGRGYVGVPAADAPVEYEAYRKHH